MNASLKSSFLICIQYQKFQKMEVYNLSRLIFVFVLIRASDAAFSLKQVDCTSPVSACDPYYTCRVHCSDDCIKNDADIFGTVLYPEYSPICKSAIHDFRISPWNASERTVTFLRVKTKNVFFGSKRMHTSSNIQDFREHLGKEDGIKSYKFLSPYISENILDVASYHRGYLYGKKGTHDQFCFINKESTSLQFDEYCNTNKEEPCINVPSIDGEGFLIAEWTIDNRSNESSNAGYQCFPENKTLSTITSIAFRKDAYFFPTTLTKTVNVNEKVSLPFTDNGACEDKATIWRKDRGDVITRDVSRNSIFFPKVEVGHAGIYSLECSNSDASRAGFVHLIVRTCPEGKHGHLCSKECPECLNGGICHDLNGECVCPPGFVGPTCEKACPPGYFGKNCNMKCRKKRVGDERACEGASICLPHPYGCSCGAGFRGLFCNKTCEMGTFGAGCSEKRECHCANGGGCNIYTGTCDGECDTNWFGKSCDVHIVAVSINIGVSSAPNLIWKLPSQFILLLLILHTSLHFSILGEGTF